MNGRAARCIEFDTVAGQKTDANEICVDVANGAIVLEKAQTNDTIEIPRFLPVLRER